MGTYPKQCERCGRAFDCGLSRCWCKDVPVSNAQYDEIVKRFDDCLCPACLAELTGTAFDISGSSGVSGPSSPTSPSGFDPPEQP